MNRCISPIVEGHGDVLALPFLLRLLFPTVFVPPPVRFPKSKLVDLAKNTANAPEVQKAVRFANANIPQGSPGLILLVIDADTQCPADLGPNLLTAMRGAGINNRDFFVAIAFREFENWIVGGHPELRLADPENVAAPKRRIAEINEGKYKETVDQPRFTSKLDVQSLAQQSPSFDRLAKCVQAFASH